MRLAIALFAAALSLSLAGPVAATNGTDCDAFRCDFQQDIAACGCDGATNHGQYVSCVAHVVKRLSKEGKIPTNCKGKIKRCAARSTCGKPGFVTCTFNELGVCDVATSTCVEPAGTTCATNADCVIDSRCRTKSSAEHCTALGGIVGTGSCCAACE